MAEADPISLHRSFEDLKLAEIMERAHRLRSALLDAFAKLESEIFSLASLLGIKSDTSAPLGHRITAFRTVAIADKKRKARLDGLLDELTALCTIRAHVVHSTISAVRDLASDAILIQFRTVPAEKCMNYSIAIDDLGRLPGKVNHLMHRFTQFRQAPAQAAPAATSAAA